MPAHAIPITVSFAVTGFQNFGAPGAIPTDPVTGSIVYDAASITSNVGPVTSIDLTIAGHIYTLAEVGSETVGSQQHIGGLLTGVGAVSSGTNDFRLDWNITTLAPIDLSYATAGSLSGPFIANSSTDFTEFSVAAASTNIPEPSSLVILLAGVLGLGVVLRRRSHLRALA
jgi:hypothetical protein